MMKQWLIQAGMAAARCGYGGVGAILALHRVVPETERSRQPDNRALEITPESLEAVIRRLQGRGCYFAPLNEVPDLLAGKDRREKFICFTFDDGYKDNAIHAYPILKQHRVPFAVNVTTSYADQRGVLWWYVLEQVLEGREQVCVTTADGRREFRLTNRAEKEAAFAFIADLARNTDQSKRDGFISELAEQAQLDARKVSNQYLMNWEEIRQLARDELVTVGAHSINHFTLNKLDANAARVELLESRRSLEGWLGKPVRHLAFPYGGPNAVGPREFEIARTSGFTTALTTRCANLFRRHALHLHCLPRLTLNGNYPVLARLDRLESGFEPARLYHGRRVITD